jgi:hypothetical protein
LREISVDSGNPFLRVSGPFLLDFQGIRIVRYFRIENEVAIANEIEILGADSFSCCSISTVRFNPASNASVIEKETFYFCQKLQSIAIPSAVTSIGESCFSICQSIAVVSFETDSRLIRLGNEAYEGCAALKSVVLPSRLETIGESCCFHCTKLEAVLFPNDSKLLRIERLAFAHCFSLESLSLPPLLEFVGENCFYDSSSFSTLRIASQLHLRELLDVPPLGTGFQVIPDSVEALQLGRSRGDWGWCTLTFGDESRLKQVRTGADPVGFRFGGPYAPSVAKFPYFVRASNRSVKLFRSQTLSLMNRGEIALV